MLDYGDQCVAENKIPNCTVYSDSNHCIKCKTNYYLLQYNYEL